jgi:hypothetical protein
MEHAHLSYANIIFKKSLTLLGQVEAKILCTKSYTNKQSSQPKAIKKKKKNSKLSNLDSPLK